MKYKASADNRPGMRENVLQKIFDLFFTTKPVGQGTGRGLSISYQIVTEQHGGQLQCFSEIGQGTKFMIDIPI
ncbi:ATP-binding protein [Okeania sp.]|uniref:sensor histidine kinase n=1 Tax=Okeania sp. TaxID=3100323 RepID=UPI002B4B0EE1|nr:ATP-binding protein [Okeania sp.]MEB3343060.1 ATP-binding protein [Okeania sp.]